MIVIGNSRIIHRFWELGSIKSCVPKILFLSFALKVESDLGYGNTGDNLALDGAELFCTPKDERRSAQISIGIWIFESIHPKMKDKWFGEKIEFSFQVGWIELLNA